MQDNNLPNEKYPEVDIVSDRLGVYKMLMDRMFRNKLTNPRMYGSICRRHRNVSGPIKRELVWMSKNLGA